MQQRLREARVESLVRSVGRRNGRRGVLARLFRRAPKQGDPAMNGHGPAGNGKVRRGFAEVDFHDRGEDVWKALRD